MANFFKVTVTRWVSEFSRGMESNGYMATHTIETYQEEKAIEFVRKCRVSEAMGKASRQPCEKVGSFQPRAGDTYSLVLLEPSLEWDTDLKQRAREAEEKYIADLRARLDQKQKDSGREEYGMPTTTRATN
jgi:hypothetical protein